MESEGDIFLPDKGYKSNVVWGWWHPMKCESFSLYADGYLEAAKRLIEPLSKGEKYNDMVALPIFFLFRHYVELTLKACIIAKTKSKKIMKGLNIPKLKYIHNLNELLSKLKNLFSPEEEFLSKSIQGRIRLLGDFDRESQTFRYPFDKNGNCLINDQMMIGMENTKKMIKEISFGLDGLLSKLIEEKDIAQSLVGELLEI